MSDEVYFDGDPEHDSARRHLERVLKGAPPRRRWPWVLAILGGGARAAWRMMQSPKPSVREPAGLPRHSDRHPSVKARPDVRQSTEKQ